MLQPAQISLCPLCDADLVSSETAEHIILNAIGGRLTTRGFICDACNHRTGREWDAVAADQLNFWCLFFGIKRQRGVSPEEPIETTAGEKLLMQPGGGFRLAKPIHSRRQTDVGTEIDITARTKGEARRILAGLKRKYPSVDVEATMRIAKDNYSYPEGVVRKDVGFGGEYSGRSVVKSALALAHHSGIAVGACEDALAYLRDANGEPCFGYYYESDLIDGRPDGIPLHCVAISANPESGLLLGYVEYFGMHRMVVCLSRTYRVSKIEAAYCLNPLTGERLPVTVALPFSGGDIDAIYNYEKIPEGSMQRAADMVIPTAMRLQFEREKERVTRCGRIRYCEFRRQVGRSSHARTDGQASGIAYGTFVALHPASSSAAIPGFLQRIEHREARGLNCDLAVSAPRRHPSTLIRQAARRCEVSQPAVHCSGAQ